MHEVAAWAAYRAKRGPLSLGLRLEYLFAASDYRMHALVRMLAQVLGGKPPDVPPFSEFIRFHDLDAADDASDAGEGASLLDVAKMFGAPLEVRDRKKRPHEVA